MGTEKTLGQLMEEALLTIEKKLAELDFNCGYPDERIKYRQEQEAILRIVEKHKEMTSCVSKQWGMTRTYPSLWDTLREYTTGL